MNYVGVTYRLRRGFDILRREQNIFDVYNIKYVRIQHKYFYVDNKICFT